MQIKTVINTRTVELPAIIVTLKSQVFPIISRLPLKKVCTRVLPTGKRLLGGALTTSLGVSSVVPSTVVNVAVGIVQVTSTSSSEIEISFTIDSGQLVIVMSSDADAKKKDKETL